MAELEMDKTILDMQTELDAITAKIEKEKKKRSVAVTNDPVNHPSHYTDGKIEVIDYIEDKKLGFCLANAVKYISRAGKKGSAGQTAREKEIEDLKKAIWYINRRIYEVENDIGA